jgi:hypothetical protein
MTRCSGAAALGDIGQPLPRHRRRGFRGADSMALLRIVRDGAGHPAACGSSHVDATRRHGAPQARAASRRPSAPRWRVAWTSSPRRSTVLGVHRGGPGLSSAAREGRRPRWLSPPCATTRSLDHRVVGDALCAINGRADTASATIEWPIRCRSPQSFTAPRAVTVRARDASSAWRTASLAVKLCPGSGWLLSCLASSYGLSLALVAHPGDPRALTGSDEGLSVGIASHPLSAIPGPARGRIAAAVLPVLKCG